MPLREEKHRHTARGKRCVSDATTRTFPDTLSMVPSVLRSAIDGDTASRRFSPTWGTSRRRRCRFDRIDGRRGYEPGNCRWATATEQNYNKRNTLRFVDLNDQPLTAKEIAHCLAMPRDVVYYRLAGGRYGRA